MRRRLVELTDKEAFYLLDVYAHRVPEIHPVVGSSYKERLDSVIDEIGHKKLIEMKEDREENTVINKHAFDDQGNFMGNFEYIKTDV